jgi:peptidyl-prolyl cis-trans isomerase C
MKKEFKVSLLIVILTLTAGLLISGCKKAPKVVAVVGSSTINQNALSDKLNDAAYYYSNDFLQTDKGKRQVLDSMIKELVIVETAKKQGLDKKEDFKKEMEKYANQLLVTEMIKNLRETSLAVKDDEIQKYYNDNITYYSNPSEIKVAHILVTSKDQADNLLAQLKSGAKFEELASKYSLDTASGKKGGELDYFTKGDMVPEFENAAFNLNKNQISEIVLTPFGYHIIKMIDSKKIAPIKLEAAAAKIKRLLEKDKFDKWFSDQEKKLNVRIKDKNLANAK